jgi:hypothetical protein
MIPIFITQPQFRVIQIYKYMYIYTCIRMRIFIHILTYTHTHKYTQTHVNTQIITSNKISRNKIGGRVRRIVNNEIITTNTIDSGGSVTEHVLFTESHEH